jgi:glycosyltransferase involved in cell wall biosynthesis
MDRKPRILQICHDHNDPFQMVARQYAHSFVDCDVKTIFLRGPESAVLAKSIYGEVEFLTLDSASLRGLKLEPARLIRQIISETPPDIIIAHRYKPFFVSLLLNQRLDIGCVIGVMHEFGFLKRIGRALLSRFWKDNVHLVGVSRPVCDEVIRQQPHLNGRVHVVHHSIEAPVLHDSVSARHKLGIPLGIYCYGVIGRLVAKKNHELLLNAFARLDGDDVLALVGDGELMEHLKKQAVKLGIADRVIFCGACDQARKYMKAFDTFVLPSTEHEAFGVVLLEAMSASTPILCTDAPGPASVVGNAARTFKCGDVDDLTLQLKAMRELSKEEVAQIAEQGLARLGEEFSISIMVQRIRELPPVLEHAPVSI